LLPELLQLLSKHSVPPQRVILLGFVVFTAVSELLADGLDLVSLSVVQLFMLVGVNELVLLRPLCDLIHELLLSLSKASDLRIMLVQVPHIVN